MKTKQPLPKKKLEKLIERLVEGDFDHDYNSGFEEHTSFISVEDYDGFAVSVSYDFYSDGPRCSAPSPTFHHTVSAGDLEFVATQEYDKIGTWKLESDEYDLSEDVSTVVNVLLHMYVDPAPQDDCAYPESLSEDGWSFEDIAQEILSKLEHEQYIAIGDEIYPLAGSVEEFINGYNNEHATNVAIDGNDYSLLTPQEAAERLAKGVY